MRTMLAEKDLVEAGIRGRVLHLADAVHKQPPKARLSKVRYLMSTGERLPLSLGSK
jgi:hypothetical protein